MLRTDGQYLSRWPAPPDGRDRVPASSPTLMRIVAGEMAGAHEVPAARARESRFVSFRRIPDYPVYVVAGFSRAAMFADWRRFLSVLAAVMVPATAGLFFVSWVALKKTRREQAIAIELREEIRRRSAAERSVLEAQKWETLSVLTGGVAHDFNNLLQVVNTSLHVHKAKYPSVADDKQIQAMTRAIRSGVRLTRQLLSFSRKQALKPETIRLQSWLPATADLIRSTLGPNVTLDFAVDDDTAAISADPAELELALLNLSLNAHHALPRGGTIRISAANVDATADTSQVVAPDPARRASVVISVKDNGIGISPQALPRVREPFFTTRTAGTGSGLGLSQVDGFASQSGGTMEIDSQVDVGTVVRLYFPAGAAAMEPDKKVEDAFAARLDGHVLLVEDNEDVAMSTMSMLISYGVRATSVPTASAALDYIGRSALPDVVLTDIAMPGMNGIELALKLRDLFPSLPVLLTTGYAEQLDVALDSGLEVMPKPIAPHDLLKRLHRVLQDRQRLRADRTSSA